MLKCLRDEMEVDDAGTVRQHEAAADPLTKRQEEDMSFWTVVDCGN